jgi:UDP-2,3-diacylglucosamine pyrophosphatase LpxH
MGYVEDAEPLRAKGYLRPLRYTMDRSPGGRLGPFRFVFNQGALRCSDAAEYGNRICYVPRDLQTTLSRESSSFVYLDVGCWVDDADGKGSRHRDFGLVCGPHVYLCEYVGGATVPQTRVPAVRSFFEGLAERGAGARVVRYCRARDIDRRTAEDPGLHLLVGDLHLPPVTWFYSKTQIAIPVERQMPEWLARAPAMRRQKTSLLRDYYGRSTYDRERGEMRQAHSPVWGTPDIFKNAGGDLSQFLDAVGSLDDALKARIHFIHTGDMYELWVGRDYHLVSGADGRSRWKESNSPDTVADWALEVMVRNAHVFAAFLRLADAGLAEVRYVGGNHDGYMMKEEMAAQLATARRDPLYRGLNGDLMVEHGHRFDGSNYDNVDGQKLLSGPGVTEWLYLVPGLRKLEAVGRAKDAFTKPSERDGYLLGATLFYLLERFHERRKPFAIYAMGHTHEAMLVRFDVRAEYTSTAHEEATAGEMTP